MQAVADNLDGPECHERVLRIHERMLALGIADNDVTRRLLARLPKPETPNPKTNTQT
jgi:hypothetical protein